MTARTQMETLQRLANLYAAVEQMHSTELQRRTLAVREVEQAIEEERSTAHRTRREGREALTAGDSVGWMISESQQVTAGSRRQTLEHVLHKRDELKNTATEQYVASHIKREQMKRVLDEIEIQAELLEERKVQAASDDRFLSRRRWTDSKEKMLAGQKMRVS